MAFITLRQANVVASPGGIVKGFPLTNAEVDNNFANLNIVIGFRENLQTNQTDNLVAAVNEINATVNDIDSNVGILSSLTTTATNNLVAAINELDLNIGDPTQLTTTATDNVVVAVNEVKASVDAAAASIIPFAIALG